MVVFMVQFAVEYLPERAIVASLWLQREYW